MTFGKLELLTDIRDFTPLFYVILRHKSSERLESSVRSDLCMQGRSQDFSVGTHSFPSHLFTPPPPKKKKIKVIFDSRVFYFKSRAQES